MRYYIVILASAAMMLSSCTPTDKDAAATSELKEVRLITLDPGHFHAALIQKTTYPDVDSTVHVYAPAGSDLDLHLARIESYNSRTESPANWNEVVYTGPDFLTQMLKEKKGNVVVLAGNNQKKHEYIHQCVSNGLNVLADKPMAITPETFERLKESFAVAASNNVLLYDIMTERYEITTMLQKELSLVPEVFGVLEKGTPEDPAVTKESVHHFYKYVSGSVLTRPAWFFDVTQEGEGIVDVTTHLVDLVQWECFPDQILDYEKDIEVLEARRWTTSLGLSQFRAITKLDKFPDYLNEDVNDSILSVYSNGEITYKIKGIHSKVSVTWLYKAAEGSGDTHYSVMRGTNCNLVIRQGAEESFKPALYVEPREGAKLTESVLQDAIAKIAITYPGVSLKARGKIWEVVIPDNYKEGHEAHFARVSEKFLEYLKAGALPDWEVPNMIAKYYTTTKGLQVARQGHAATAH
jgi:predicted dehydrogenase